ncbi:MAG: hypothetical protein HY751_12545 [Nitrospinae bacterium]|nr:hypothetical protein [Nitrospinota bacterium]
MDGNGNEKELKALSQAIMEAITRNEDVMALLQDLKKRQVVDSSTLLGLALRIGEIIEVSGMMYRQDEIEEMTETPMAETGEEKQELVLARRKELVDGREQSKNEVSFREWVAERFDERAWLKKARLIF